MISFEAGRDYYFETFGRYYVGHCTEVRSTEALFDSLAWIANTGRPTQFFASGKAENMEVELMGDGWAIQLPYICNRREWKFGVFTEQV